jgi:hypothetical protein
MAIKLDPGSRFQFTPTVLATTPTGEIVETFGVWKKPSFLKTRPNEDVIGKFQVTTAEAGKPDIIATRLYGSPYLDWIIIAFNKTTDVLNWPQPGAIIE